MGNISFSALGNVFVVPDLRRKLFFTLAMLAIYRFGSFLTVPGINAAALSGSLKNGVFDFLNLWTGGGLGHAAVFGLGIMPYITASIIMQLMTVVVPSLAELQKEGETGYMKINRITRYMTVVLALFQAIGFFFVLKSQSATSTPLLPADFQIASTAGIARLLLFVVSMTAGTVLLMWIGELITQRGIGNGMSLLIFSSIISRLVPGLRTWLSLGVGTKLAVPVLLVAITAAVVFIQEGQRRIPVQYAKRMVGRRMTSGGSTYLPLRVNMAGVIRSQP
jgi:preprotein translocase subunit SecY